MRMSTTWAPYLFYPINCMILIHPGPCWEGLTWGQYLLLSWVWKEVSEEMNHNMVCMPQSIWFVKSSQSLFHYQTLCLLELALQGQFNNVLRAVFLSIIFSQSVCPFLHVAIDFPSAIYKEGCEVPQCAGRIKVPNRNLDTRMLKCHRAEWG